MGMGRGERKGPASFPTTLLANPQTLCLVQYTGSVKNAELAENAGYWLTGVGQFTT